MHKYDIRKYIKYIYTVCSQKNGAVSKVNKISISSTALDQTCCIRKQPPSPLATPFAGSNTMRFLSLGVY